MRLSCGCVVALTFGVAVFEVIDTSTAEQRQENPPSIAARLSTPSSPNELEAAIQSLGGVNDEQFGKILFDLQRLADLKEQQRLQHLLEQRIKDLQPREQISNMSPDDASAAQTIPGRPPLTDEVLSMRIETLNLRPDATADDLRVRDQLISEIAGIRDPILRDKLLAKLEERERQSQEATQRP